MKTILIICTAILIANIAMVVSASKCETTVTGYVCGGNDE